VVTLYFPPVIAQQICPYLVEAGYDTNFETRFLSYPDPYTAVKLNGGGDTNIAIGPYRILDRALIEFTIVTKQDEMWLGVTNNLGAILSTSGYWNHDNCWAYYGGRKSKINKESRGYPELKKIELNSEDVSCDSGYGNIQTPDKTHHKLFPYVDGDVVHIYVDVKQMKMGLWHNQKFMCFQDVSGNNGWGSFVFPFVVTDVEGDRLGMTVNYSPKRFDPEDTTDLPR